MAGRTNGAVIRDPKMHDIGDEAIHPRDFDDDVIRATAKAVEAREGTIGGHIVGNIFNGSKLGGSRHNDSWADVKGDKCLIEGNRGGTDADGFRTREIIDGWGTGNVFRDNIIDLGGSGGVGIKDTVGGNTIDCTDKVIGGRLTDRGQCT